MSTSSRPPDGIVGVVFNTFQDSAAVTAIIPGSPAEGHDIKITDKLLEVNGVSVSGRPLTEISNMIRGPAGTVVSLTLQRMDTNEQKMVSILRKPRPDGALSSTQNISSPPPVPNTAPPPPPSLPRTAAAGPEPKSYSSAPQISQADTDRASAYVQDLWRKLEAASAHIVDSEHLIPKEYQKQNNAGGSLNPTMLRMLVLLFEGHPQYLAALAEHFPEERSVSLSSAAPGPLVASEYNPISQQWVPVPDQRDSLMLASLHPPLLPLPAKSDKKLVTSTSQLLPYPDNPTADATPRKISAPISQPRLSPSPSLASQPLRVFVGDNSMTQNSPSLHTMRILDPPIRSISPVRVVPPTFIETRSGGSPVSRVESTYAPHPKTVSAFTPVSPAHPVSVSPARPVATSSAAVDPEYLQDLIRSYIVIGREMSQSTLNWISYKFVTTPHPFINLVEDLHKAASSGGFPATNGATERLEKFKRAVAEALPLYGKDASANRSLTVSIDELANLLSSPLSHPPTHSTERYVAVNDTSRKQLSREFEQLR